MSDVEKQIKEVMELAVKASRHGWDLGVSEDEFAEWSASRIRNLRALREKLHTLLSSAQRMEPADEVSARARKGQQIDEAYAHKLAVELECMLIDPTAYWDSAAKLLDEYKAAWNEINPSPPLFGSDFPVPPERKAIYAAMKARRAAISATQPAAQGMDAIAALQKVRDIAVSALLTGSLDRQDWIDDMDRIAAQAKQGGAA